MISKLKVFIRKAVNKTKNFFSTIRHNPRKLVWAAWQATYCVGSMALLGYVLNYFLPVWLAAAIMSTAVVHEFAHYFTAIKNGRRADLPFFVPFIWGVYGGTRIHDRGSVPEADAKIHMAGPTWGFLFASAGAAFAAYHGLIPMAWSFFWLAAFNVWHGTFGSDGKFYATMKKILREEEEANSGDFTIPDSGTKFYPFGAAPAPVV